MSKNQESWHQSATDTPWLVLPATHTLNWYQRMMDLQSDLDLHNEQHGRQNRDRWEEGQLSFNNSQLSLPCAMIVGWDLGIMRRKLSPQRAFPCATEMIPALEWQVSPIYHVGNPPVKETMFGQINLINSLIKTAQSAVSKNWFFLRRNFENVTLVARRRVHFRGFWVIFLDAQLPPKRGVLVHQNSLAFYQRWSHSVEPHALTCPFKQSNLSAWSYPNL